MRLSEIFLNKKIIICQLIQQVDKTFIILNSLYLFCLLIRRLNCVSSSSSAERIPAKKEKKKGKIHLVNVKGPVKATFTRKEAGS